VPLTDRERWLMLQAWEGAMDHADGRAFEIWMEAVVGRAEEGGAIVSAPRETILGRQAADRFGEPAQLPEVPTGFAALVERERALLRQADKEAVTHELLREIRDLLRPRTVEITGRQG